MSYNLQRILALWLNHFLLPEDNFNRKAKRRIYWLKEERTLNWIVLLHLPMHFKSCKLIDEPFKTYDSHAPVSHEKIGKEYRYNLKPIYEG